MTEIQNHTAFDYGMVSEIPEIALELTTVVNGAESDFLSLGKVLQNSTISVSGLVKKASETAGLASDDGHFSSAEKGIKDALENLSDQSASVKTRSEVVRKVVDCFGDLNSKRAEIEIIAKYLRAVALNIFIETARSEVRNQNFSIIASEIKELSEKIIGMAKEIREESEEAMNHFRDVYKEILSGVGLLENLTGDAETSVLDSVSAIRKLIGFSLEAVNKAETMSKQISSEIGNIVVGVQFHDDMRQRIEHISTALDGIESTDDEPTQAALAECHAVLAVQMAQLQQVSGELGTIYTQQQGAFDRIIDEVGVVISLLSEEGGDQTADDDLFTKLSISLGDFQALESRGTELTSRLAEEYKTVSETTRDLAEQAKQINEISKDSHIKALNAIIATQNMGIEGKTLLTLAGEMKALSQQAGDFATDVNGIIDDIVSLVKQLAIDGDSDVDESGDGEAKMTQDELVLNISAVCGQMQNETETMKHQAEALGDQLREARTGLDFIPRLNEVIEEKTDGLKSIIEAIRQVVPESVLEEVRVSSELADYTMEKEREVHERTMKEMNSNFEADAADPDLAAETEETQPVPDAVTDESEFDDNIELF